jgi:amino acid transporter
MEMASRQSVDRRGRISVFSLAMMNFAAVANLRNLPAMAGYGVSMLFFYAVAVLTFLIPTAVVSAELATGFPEGGGIFNWVNKSLGNKIGVFGCMATEFFKFCAFPSFSGLFGWIGCLFI